MKVKALSLVVYMLVATYSPCAINTSKVLSNSLIGNALNFDSTYVLDDLYSATNFNISDYYIDLEGAKKHPQIISFTEYCFDKEMKLENYSLYFYLYNPQLIRFNYESSLNKIQFSIGEHEYYKYGIELLSKSDDSRFLKFKIKLDDSELKRIKEEINVDKRVYNVSGIELLRTGNNNANDYFASDSSKQIGGTYTYTGFAKGYGSDQSTLNCEVKDLEVISLDVKDLWKRYDTSNLFKKTQVNSVYFSIPNYYFDVYNFVSSIDFEYYKFRTSPVFVLRNTDNVYSRFKSYVGKTWTNDNNPGYSLYTLGYQAYDIKARDIYGSYDYSYGFDDNDLPQTNKIAWLFDGGKDGLDDISSEQLKNYMYSYDSAEVKTNVNYKGISNDLFELSNNEEHHIVRNVKRDDLGNILKADETFWGRILGRNTETSYKTLEEVDYDNISAEDLIFDNSFIDEFTNDCKTNKNNDEKTYILRFDSTPYYSANIWDKKITDLTATGVDGYVFQEYVYLDFDIIDFHFDKDGIDHIVACVSNPIDIVSPGEAPSDGWDWLKELLEKIWAIVKIILLVLSIVGIVWLIFKGVDLMASMKILFGGKKAKKKNKKK